MEIKNVLDKVKAFEQEQIEKQKKSSSPKKSSSTADKVSLSQEAKLYAKALNVARQSPEERSEKIAVLKEQIANNTYQPDAQKIAEKLVKEELDLWS